MWLSYLVAFYQCVAQNCLNVLTAVKHQVNVHVNILSIFLFYNCTIVLQFNVDLGED